MKFIQEFKEFAVKGNVVDMGIGIIIGGAFGKIVTSFVNDILMPPLGVLLGGVNFSDLKITIRQVAGVKPAVTWNYGNFIQVTVDFLIVAFAIFMMVKVINKMKKQEENKAAEPNKQEQLLIEIRDLLKK